MRSTPARLTTPGAAKLPRLVLLGLALAYIVAGLFMRDPWKTDDVVGLATMITTLREGGSTWLLPQIGHLAFAQEGPLITWVGALSIRAFGPLVGDIAAGRLPNLLWFSICAASLWYGTYLVSRRPEAQPLALPFGGEPPPRDYGRMLADVALLLLIATVGILQRVHETSVIPAIIAWQAMAFYALARSLDKPFSGALALGVALAGCFLTRGWVGLPSVSVAVLAAYIPRGALRSRARWLPLAVLVATALILMWWIPATHSGYPSADYWIRNWKAWNIANFDWPNLPDMGRTARDLGWYLWPAWPLALVAAWHWRNWLTSPHIWLGLVLAVCALAQIWFTDDPDDAEYIMLAVPCAALGAMSMPTLRRGAVNTLDWFAVMCFSLTAGTAWLGWVALHFNWPPTIHNNIVRQTTGYHPTISWTAAALGLFVTLVWISAIAWRLRQRPPALWRGAALAAGGLSTTWILLVLLWQPAVDYARSYRTASHELAAVLAANVRPGECVRSVGMGAGQRASFLIFDNLNFPYDPNCTLILQQTTRNSLRDGTAAYVGAGAQELWRGGRLSDRYEIFRLLRVPPAR